MSPAAVTARDPRAEEELVKDMGGFTRDPVGFVRYAFAWSEGELQGHSGPRDWQVEVLTYLRTMLDAGVEAGSAIAKAIQIATSSGHGIGKSALVSWIILWGMSTFEDTRGVVTANTENQLKLKTWAELSKWHRLSINSHWFVYTATSLYSSDPAHEKTWRMDMVPWSLTNPEAFAGLHNQGKRIILIFDEASAIPDKIWEVAEGALTDADTEIIWAVFGNPTRNTGRFRECFGARRHRWRNWVIDSRDVDGTNKLLFAEWVEDWGEDSDFVRVRVRGLFPRASSMQLIDSELVAKAMKREPLPLIGDPLIMSLDIARGGDDNCVFKFRRGLDARTIPSVTIPGSEVRDSMRLVSKAVDLVTTHKPDAFFFDGTGVGGPVGDRIRQLGHPVFEVQFGATSPNPKQANMRAYMWQKMKEWLQAGGAIEDSHVLETDLTSVEYSHNSRDQLLLEPKDAMKRRGLASPDMGDALAMTFAFNVPPKSGPGVAAGGARPGTLISDWDPLAADRI